MGPGARSGERVRGHRIQGRNMEEDEKRVFYFTFNIDFCQEGIVLSVVVALQHHIFEIITSL